MATREVRLMGSESRPDPLRAAKAILEAAGAATELGVPEDYPDLLTDAEAWTVMAHALVFIAESLQKTAE